MREALYEVLRLLAVVAVVLAPGLGLGWGLSRRLGWGLAAMLATAFSVTTALAGVVGLAGRLAGFGMGTATAVFWVAAVALTVAGVWLGRGGEPLEWDWQGLVVGLAAGVLAWWERPWFDFTPDTFYHMAAVRSLFARGETLVTDPFHDTATTSLDPTSGIWHTVMGLARSTTTLEVEQVFFWATVIGAAVTLVAFWALLRRLTESSWAATGGALAYAVFGLLADVRLFGLPNRLSLAFAFLALLALSELVSEWRWEAVALFLLGGAAALGTHLATAQMLAVVFGMFVLWLFVRLVWPGTEERREVGVTLLKILAIALALAIIAAPVLLPKVATVGSSSIVGTGVSLQRDTILRISETAGIIRPGFLVGGGPVSFGLVLALVVLMGWRVLARQDSDTLPSLAIASAPALLLFNPLITPFLVDYSYYMVDRVGGLLAFAPFAAMAWGWSRWDGETWQKTAALLAAAALVAHAFGSWTRLSATFVEVSEEETRLGQAYPVPESREADVRDSWGPSAVFDARAIVGERYPRVAATPETGYAFAGFVPVSVVAAPLSHSPLAIEGLDGPARREAMSALMEPDATASERRAILEEWDAEYVVLWTAEDEDLFARESMLAQPELFEPLIDTRRLTLLAVR
jgi:hypothetical protein